MIVLSVAGFITQVSYVSSQYFLFRTTTNVKFDLAEVAFNETVTVCFRIADILNYTKIREETGIHLKKIQSLSDTYKMYETVTIKQIFDATPHEDSDIIKSCVYRPDKWQVLEATTEKCNEVFSISRFYTMESMCYQFRENNPDTTDVTVDHSPLYRARYNTITFSDLFNQVNLVNVIVSDDDDLPYRARDFSSVLPHFRRWDSENEYEYNFVYTASIYLTINFLPPPYDTMCKDVPDEKYFTCLKYCLLNKFDKVDAVPASQLWREAYNKKAFIASNETNQETKD